MDLVDFNTFIAQLLESTGNNMLKENTKSLCRNGQMISTQSTPSSFLI